MDCLSRYPAVADSNELSSKPIKIAAVKNYLQKPAGQLRTQPESVTVTKQTQLRDPEIRILYKWKTGNATKEILQHPLIRRFKDLKDESERLCRIGKSQNPIQGTLQLQLVLPEESRPMALFLSHDSPTAAHQGSAAGPWNASYKPYIGPI